MIALAKSHPHQSAEYSTKLSDLWALFVQYKGGLRVMASAAAILGYTESECLPAPLQAMSREDKKTLEELIHRFELT
jgi:4-hydroxy-tetrahydrodipicolinate synthase